MPENNVIVWVCISCFWKGL